MAGPPPDPQSFDEADTPLPASPLRRVAQPIVRFLQTEAAGGVVLLAATVLALIWANSPWREAYSTLWSTRFELGIGSYQLHMDFVHVVNDLLLALFFFVVGLEIKHELVIGELRDPRSVGLPAVAAVGGMVMPAAIYVLINAGGPGAHGWGIPMATDIAFAVSVVAVLGRRVPGTVKVFLLTLAIVDDIGVILVIALFYGESLRPSLLLVAAALTVVIAVALRSGVSTPVLLIGGSALWLVVFESGVHATIAGVAMGLIVPARPTATIERLIDSLHPWTSFVVLPLFALANAGIVLSAGSLTAPSRVLIGVIVALVIGKPLGITTFAWLAVRTGIGNLPSGARWRHVIGASAVAGIGFTVSLFVAGLAFRSKDMVDDAALGILIASVLAAALGTLLLLSSARADGESQ